MSNVEPNRVTLTDLVIETTRRCNMNCCHCLRGEPQNIDMDINHVAALFKHIDRVGVLTLSGGEPSLVPEVLIKIIDLAVKYETEIESFYIATNGKEVSEDFIRAIFEWWMFCFDAADIYDRGNGVEISSDIYHQYVDEDNVKKLMAFRFVEKRDVDSNYNDGKQLVWEGRAAENFVTSNVRDPGEVDIEENCDTINHTLYLDCLGNLHTCCDLSFDTMDKGEFKIGNVSENNFNLINAIKSYNLKLEEVVC